MLNPELKDLFTGNKRTVLVESIEVIHEETGYRKLLCKYSQDLKLTLEDGTTETFQASNFVVQLPQYDENGSLDITVSFAMVGFEDIKEIENIMTNFSSKLQFKYRFYLEDSLSYPQLQAPFLFSVSAIDINKRNVSFNGALLLSVQKKVPSILYSVENFRGLKY